MFTRNERMDCSVDLLLSNNLVVDHTALRHLNFAHRTSITLLRALCTHNHVATGCEEG